MKIKVKIYILYYFTYIYFLPYLGVSGGQDGIDYVISLPMPPNAEHVTWGDISR